MGTWQTIFKKKGIVFYKPQEDMRKVIRTLKKEKVNKVLDLGCGSGRHVVMLAKSGFDVYGMDLSKEGLKLTRKAIRALNLKAKLKQASCYKKFPFKNDFFDAIISTQVIHHNFQPKVRFCISEIERVLKPQGVLFVTVASSYSGPKYMGTKKFKHVKPRTYIPLDGAEKGLPHYIYTKTELKKDFKNFKVIDIHKDKGNHYCLLGKLKK